MAEGGPTQSVTCRYNLHGACRLGENCHFSHDRINSRQDNTCKFYLKGLCTYGSRCRYDHTRNSQSSEVPESSIPSPSLPPPIQAASAVSSKVKIRADAPEFVPRSQMEQPKPKEKKPYTPMTFAQKVGQSKSSKAAAKEAAKESKETAVEKSKMDAIVASYSELCPFYLVNHDCKFDPCQYMHGNICEMCDLACLHPFDQKQCEHHTDECMKLMEDDMELSFKMANLEESQSKVCGICMENVLEKTPKSKRLFAILPNCSHCFCVICLRQWRQSTQFENKIIRSCPECRVHSDFVVPSSVWLDDKHKEDKVKMVDEYKNALSEKPCKYFQQGTGDCPFGNKCFYLHALPDGTKHDVGPPCRKQRFNADGEQLEPENFILEDFMGSANERIAYITGTLQNMFEVSVLEALRGD